MRVEVQLRIVGDGGEIICDDTDVLAIDKHYDRLEAIGLSLDEGKAFLAGVQQHLVAAQAATFAAGRQCCAHCGHSLQRKGRAKLTFRTAFGNVAVDSPRLHRCRCAAAVAEKGPQTFSPLTLLLTSHTAPELLYLESRWASLVSYGMTVDLLKDVLPIDARLNPKTVRNHLHRIAGRLESELGDERPNFIDSCPREWKELPLPEGEIVVGIDGGYVRDWADRKSHFGILVGKSSPRDRDDRYLGLVQSFDVKPKRRLWELLRSQGLQMNQAVTFPTDGGDDVRNLAAEMAPYAEHHLDWFHITMRLTVLGQYAKGLIHHDQEAGERIARNLLRIKRYLWHGNSRAALFWVEDLADDLYGLEEDCTYPKRKAFSQAVAEFVTYIQRNAHAIPNYGERYRNDERIAKSFVESAVNVVIAKRFTKKQQMQWSRCGTHMLLQIRTRTLDGTLRRQFERWYPGLAANDDQPLTQAVAA